MCVFCPSHFSYATTPLPPNGYPQAKLNEIILQRHGESTAEQVDDALHAAAFGDSYTLGKPLTPGPCALSADGLKEFREARCVPPFRSFSSLSIAVV